MVLLFILTIFFIEFNEAPRRKQRGIFWNYFIYAASGGELNP